MIYIQNSIRGSGWGWLHLFNFFDDFSQFSFFLPIILYSLYLSTNNSLSLICLPIFPISKFLCPLFLFCKTLSLPFYNFQNSEQISILKEIVFQQCCENRKNVDYITNNQITLLIIEHSHKFTDIDSIKIFCQVPNTPYIRFFFAGVKFRD